jgi:uncharacterized membrane protein YedE/YeeE
MAGSVSLLVLVLTLVVASFAMNLHGYLRVRRPRPPQTAQAWQARAIRPAHYGTVTDSSVSNFWHTGRAATVTGR